MVETEHARVEPDENAVSEQVLVEGDVLSSVEAEVEGHSQGGSADIGETETIQLNRLHLRLPECN